jgi:hypothetical protein
VGGVLIKDRRPIFPAEAKDFAMIEILFVYQLIRDPLQVIARRWWCVSLFRATRGRRRCAGCKDA